MNITHKIKKNIPTLFQTVLLGLLIFNMSIFAGPEVDTAFFETKGGESLETINSEVLKIQNIPQFNQEQFFQNMIEWNPHISNWRNIPAGETLYVELPYGFMPNFLTPPPSTPSPSTSIVENSEEANTTESVDDIDDFDDFDDFDDEENDKEMNELVLSEDELESSDPNKKSNWSLSSFVAFSQGDFLEDASNSTSVSSSQTSPITLGLAANKSLNQNWSVSGSAYFSKLTATTSDEQGNIDVPWERGLTVYLERGYSFLTPYIGFDHEFFSTFNTHDLVSETESISVVEHTLNYFTIGAFKVFSLFNKPLLVKLSYSKSLNSQVSRDEYLLDGSKFILFGAYKAHKKISYTAFYKQHNLSGLTEVLIQRYSVGLSYTFF
jgi:hypothetical protein